MTQHAKAEPAPSNLEIVRSVYEHVINEREFNLLPELISPDYVGPRGERGPAGFADTIRGLVAGVPDIRFEIQDWIEGADAVAIRWRWSGHHTGVLFGLAPSNRHVTNTGIAIYHLSNGKIVRSVLETDRLGLLQQIGVVSEDLGAPRRVE